VKQTDSFGVIYWAAGSFWAAEPLHTTSVTNTRPIHRSLGYGLTTLNLLEWKNSISVWTVGFDRCAFCSIPTWLSWESNISCAWEL
jgi:hypothetical protein